MLPCPWLPVRHVGNLEWIARITTDGWTAPRAGCLDQAGGGPARPDDRNRIGRHGQADWEGNAVAGRLALAHGRPVWDLAGVRPGIRKQQPLPWLGRSGGGQVAGRRILPL